MPAEKALSVAYVLLIESVSGGLVGPAEVREKLHEELDLQLPPDLDPASQTDDTAFSMFDVEDEDG